MPESNDYFGLKLYASYLEQSRNKWACCQKWYKWLSIVPLSLSLLLSGLAVFLIHAGYIMMITAGDRDEGLVGDDKPCILRCVRNNIVFAGLGIFIAGIVFVLGSMLMMVLSFMYFYEKVNMAAPVEFFIVKEGDEYPKTLLRRAKMNKNSKILGPTPDVICGKLVYTGWMLTEHDEWVHCNERGQIVVDRYSEQQVAEFQRQQRQQRDLEANNDDAANQIAARKNNWVDFAPASVNNNAAPAPYSC